MSSVIRLLDEQTINLIAAGEVVENPASVVKELVENALDAKATEICIEISAGGRQLIRIIDNGAGMSSDDALLCLERHATSKIRQVDDMGVLSTMGFRGEALPSIAALSKMTILTSQGGASGTCVVVQGGKILQHTPVSTSKGTTVEICSLFYNAPARRKFQKSLAIDTAEIVKVVGSLALANPSIYFKLLSNGQLLIGTKSHFTDCFMEKLAIRTEEVLGHDFFDKMSPIDLQEGQLHLKGFISDPRATRINRSGQHLFINQRMVFCHAISQAVLDGYGTLLTPRRYPNFVLHLSLPGDLVDVNVHPQKREIRLRDSSSIKQFISRTVSQNFAAHTGSYLSPYPEALSAFEMAAEEPVGYSFEASAPSKCAPASDQDLLPSNKKDLFTPSATSRTQTEPSMTNEPSCFHSFKLIGLWPPYIIVDPLQIDLGSLQPSWKNKKGALLLVHQRLAHSRVLFDNYMQQFVVQKQTSISLQELITPIHLEFSQAESLLLLHHIEELNKLGIAIRPFGKQTYIVDALPHDFPSCDIENLLKDILNDIDQMEKRQTPAFKAATAAAKAAVNRKAQLNSAEAELLVQQLLTCSPPLLCPNGRAILALLESEELEKKFRKERDS